ncbi:MAG TPA: hypothetical protein V6C88_01390 [Chroococcidiopsis sp.]
MTDNRPSLPPIEFPPSFPPGARAALRHWHQYRPQMYADLHASGTLHEMAIAADEATAAAEDALHMAFIDQGYANPIAFEMARQAVRERYIYLPSEDDVPELQINDEGLYSFESQDVDDE